MRVLTLACVALLLAACGQTTAPVPEVRRDPRADCEQVENAALRVSGCTSWINGGGLTDEQLANAYYNRADAYETQKQYPAARSDFSQVIRIAPNWGVGYLRRGFASEEQHLYQAARDDFSTAAPLLRAQQSQPDDAKLTLSAEQGVLRMDDRIVLEDRWANYVAGIQDAHDYANWSAPPNDLYAQSSAAEGAQ